MSNDWKALFDPLSDDTREVFEREFPEIPTGELCGIVVEFRSIGAMLSDPNRITARSKVQEKIDSAERSVQNLLYLLDPQSCPPKRSRVQPIPEEVWDAVPAPRAPLIAELRAFRSALWSARPTALPNEAGALVAALKRRFDRAGIPVTPHEGGRFVTAVRIVMGAIAPDAETREKLETARGLQSLARDVGYHLEKMA